jgi:hypothetical protein
MSGPPQNPLDQPLLEAMAALIASDLIDGSVHVLDRRDLAVRAAREGIWQTIDLARRVLEETAADHEHAGEAANAVILYEAAEQIRRLPKDLP